MKLLIVSSILALVNAGHALDSSGNGPTQSSAVALYVFNPSNIDMNTGIIRDLAPDPLNLQIVRTSALYYSRPDHLEITEPNLIRSVASADKITTACKASNEMTIEMWIDSRTPAERLVNHEDDMLPPNHFIQSLRLVSLADTYFKEYHNFGFYQAYNMGDAYKGSVRTSANSNGNNLSGDFVAPLVSQKEAFLPQTKQHVVFTKTRGGTANLYVSDETGYDTLAVPNFPGFGGTHANWHSSGTTVTYNTPDDNTGAVTRALDIRLGIGNEPSASNDFSKPTIGGEGPTKHSRHWPWVGKIYMVAIYCRALTDVEILGAAAPNTVAPPVFPINLSRAITPSMIKAQQIHTRLTGTKTPIDNPLIATMADLLDQNKAFEAAAEAAKDPNFYNIVVRDMAIKMSTREENIGAELNDFTATVVGAVRDGVPFNQMLSNDLVYEATTSRAAVPSNIIRDKLTSNNHYRSLGAGGYSLYDVLQPARQMLFNGTVAVPNPDPAGLLTTRAFMAAHAIAGTNRRPLEYAFREFMCAPIEKWADSNGSDAFIGRDIDRFPGGSHTKYTTTCRACHSRMDPMRGAFAYFTFSNNFTKHSFLVPRVAVGTMEDDITGMAAGLRNGDPALNQLPNQGSVAFVTAKMNHNDTVFPGGRVIIDNSFQNSAADAWGMSYFGWTGATSGNGVGEFGAMIGRSEQFTRCMAQRVFASVCKREPATFDDELIRTVAAEFKQVQSQLGYTKSYQLDYLFKRLVVTPNCLGEDK